MNRPDYNSPTELKNFLDDKGMAMQKKFGQNFMVNPVARKKIISMLELSQNDTVWEVGPGLGCMTEMILKSGADLTAFEIDWGFIKCLHNFFKEEEEKNQFRIIDGDVLKTWEKQAEQKKPSKVFGNLPYNIAATFVAGTITSGLIFDRCVFTVQKEVAKRCCAKVSSSNYSAFSVLCQYAYDVKLGIELSGGNFWPSPNVVSQAVLMKKKSSPMLCADSSVFVKTVHAIFANRRKTVRNNIKALVSENEADSIFEKTMIDPKSRAEDLSVEKFILLANEISGIKR